MELTIKSKKLDRTFNFWAPDDGGYVRLVTERKHGTLGQQICEGGRFSGSALHVGPRSFERTCRNWYRAYVRDSAVW